MTTAEAPAVNAHQPVTEPNRIRCAAPDCGYAMQTYQSPSGNTGDWAAHFRQMHTAQHNPGRAPDIAVDWVVSGSCSVCEDTIGDIEIDGDGDGVRCKDCGTFWSMDGTGGERDTELDTVEQLIEAVL